jgi:hypothetical protein
LVNVHDPTDSHRALRRAVSDGRVLGFVFLLLGSILCVFSLLEPSSILGQALTLSASLLLVGPGVLYLIAAHTLKHRKPSGAVLARRASAAHLLACAVTFTIGAIGFFGSIGRMLLIPAIAMIFFIPALIAFLAETRSALRAAQALDSGRAFEPVVAQPVDQSVNLRAK